MLISQKQIYNNHLIASRKAKNQPFKIKKDFSNVEEKTIMTLEKLDRFFKNYENVDQQVFFSAPYRMFPDENHFSLEFFLSQKAIKCYTQHIKLLEVQNPDSDESLIRLQGSLKFILNFCLENGLTLGEYETTIEGSMPCFVEHLKNHKINYYTLHALSFKSPQLDSRIIDFIFPDFFEVFQKTKNNFYSSKKMKEFAKLAKQKLTDKLTVNN